MGGSGGAMMSSSSTGMPGTCIYPNVPSCLMPSDCPTMNTGCTTVQCVNSCCYEQFTSIGTACTDNGGVVCNNQGQCVECVNGTMCLLSGSCDLATWSCSSPDCTDGMMNGTETDVDCGGMACPGCTTGMACLTGSDCLGGVCDANSMCQPCGGDADCATLPGTYCNGGTCDMLLMNGTVCTGANECQSGQCIDGVCCDTACGSTCEACDLTGSEGTCTPVANGNDPDTECAATAQSTCGANGMGCNGTGACVLWPNGTNCSSPSCSAGVATTAGTCDGMGTCGNTTTMCTPYVCGLTACLTNCSANGDADCVTTHYCNGSNQCVPKLAQGQVCGTTNQCSSGNCVDGFCCDNACGALCQSCAAADTGGVNGTCAPVTMSSDPASECGTNCCNGAGVCDTSNACP
jgi:hypothetical protein